MYCSSDGVMSFGAYKTIAIFKGQQSVDDWEGFLSEGWVV